MKRKAKILIAFGTRPEALKFAPLIQAFQKSKSFTPTVCLTGQHRQMVDQVVQFFKIPIKHDLHLMESNQSLEALSSRILSHFGAIVTKVKPDLVFVQGDTISALMAGLCAYYHKVPVAHLEAGLRSWDKYQPFPEEISRVLLAKVADFHFAPTKLSKTNLIKEGVSKKNIFEVGNTIIDTLKIAKPRIQKKYSCFKGLDPQKRLLFVTAHRRENFGNGLEQICNALKRTVQNFKDVEILYPVHLNPNVSKCVRQSLGKNRSVHLTRPLTYEETCWAMKHAYLILTDSGGIQEEAPSFKKPVLVMRNVTERSEGIQAGVSKLVGTDANTIYRETKKLLTSSSAYKRMQQNRNPYGDGKSTARILQILKKRL